jgi:hypothetical protein
MDATARGAYEEPGGLSSVGFAEGFRRPHGLADELEPARRLYLRHRLANVVDDDERLFRAPALGLRVHMWNPVPVHDHGFVVARPRR